MHNAYDSEKACERYSIKSIRGPIGRGKRDNYNAISIRLRSFVRNRGIHKDCIGRQLLLGSEYNKINCTHYKMKRDIESECFV